MDPKQVPSIFKGVGGGKHNQISFLYNSATPYFTGGKSFGENFKQRYFVSWCSVLPKQFENLAMFNDTITKKNWNGTPTR